MRVRVDQVGNTGVPELLPSCQKHTKCIVTHAASLSERDSKASLLTPTHHTNEKVPTSKHIGKAEKKNNNK